MTNTLKHVDQALALATAEIAPFLMPAGWIVTNDVPDCLEGIIQFFQQNGKIAVSDYWGDDTLFDSPELSQAFNAWHDYRHITALGSFDQAGERRVNDAMHEDLFHWWNNSRVPITSAAYQRAKMVLNVHNVGRLDFWHAYGEAPPNPRDFALGFLTARGMIEIPTPLPPGHCHPERGGQPVPA